MANASRTYVLALALFMLLLVIAGFWPSYFGPLVNGAPFRHHWIFHLHATVFLAWMVILILQISLLARGKTRAHMRLGRKGFVLALAVSIMGIAAIVVSAAALVEAGASSRLTSLAWEFSAPLTDISQFAILVGLGWAFRRKPEFHKRYMIFATIAILPAATARLEYLLGQWSLEWLFVLLIALALGRDWRQDRRLHPASLIGSAILFPRLFLNLAYKFIG